MYGKTNAGVALAARVDSIGAMVCRDAITEAALNGRLFMGANQTPVATSTTLNTTFTGLGLCNPTGSGKLFIVHEFGYALDQACAGESVLALATTTESGFSAGTPIIVRSARWGCGGSSAILTAAATIVAPIIIKIIATLGQGIDTTQLMPPPTLIPVKGIVIPAGRALVTDTTVATGATSIQFHFMWEEVDEG